MVMQNSLAKATATGNAIPRKYAELLATHAPRPIRTKTEYRRLLKLAEQYTRPKLSKDEALFLDLIGGLIETYESAHFPVPDAPPGSMLEHLLESREMTRAEFARQVGVSRQLVTDMIKGRVTIMPEHIRKFADFFQVSPEVFLPCA